MKMRLDDLTLDKDVQQRTRININTVKSYIEAMEEKLEFPPVTVFSDGEKNWVADGFHRVFAARALKLEELEADVRQGSKRDAILHSVGSNDSHGLPRTNEDKRKAVTTMLSDSEWRQWSDKQIARQCAVSARFVGKIRLGLFPTVNGSQTESKPDVRKCADGRNRNIANIGRPQDEDVSSIFDKVLQLKDNDINTVTETINIEDVKPDTAGPAPAPEAINPPRAEIPPSPPPSTRAPAAAPHTPARDLPKHNRRESLFAEQEPYPTFLMSVYTGDDYKTLSDCSAAPTPRPYVDYRIDSIDVRRFVMGNDLLNVLKDGGAIVIQPEV